MKLGFLGLGNMGGPMAMNLLAADYHLTVHDLDPKMAEGLIASGADWAATPLAVAAASDVYLLLSRVHPRWSESSWERRDWHPGRSPD